MKTDDIDVLARTIYGEARGEYGGQAGMASLVAVGNVVMNRLTAGVGMAKPFRRFARNPGSFPVGMRTILIGTLLCQKRLMTRYFSCVRRSPQKYPNSNGRTSQWGATIITLQQCPFIPGGQKGVSQGCLSGGIYFIN